MSDKSFGAGRRGSTAPPRPLSFAVVVPALNEAKELPACLTSLRTQGALDIVVVDGGSTDHTVAIAQTGGARVLRAEPPQRARQMNAGAAAAAAGDPDVLLFLGADCRLPPRSLDAVGRLLVARPELVGGSFSLSLCDRRTESHHNAERRLRYMTAFSNAFCAHTGTLMCDRAIFVRRSAFEQLGGFRDLPVMEDVDLGRRLRTLGRTVVLRAPAVASSGRRFVGPGGWLVGARIVAACVAFSCGLPADGLVQRLYKPRGGRC